MFCNWTLYGKTHTSIWASEWKARKSFYILIAYTVYNISSSHTLNTNSSTSQLEISCTQGSYGSLELLLSADHWKNQRISEITKLQFYQQRHSVLKLYLPEPIHKPSKLENDVDIFCRNENAFWKVHRALRSQQKDISALNKETKMLCREKSFANCYFFPWVLPTFQPIKILSWKSATELALEVLQFAFTWLRLKKKDGAGKKKKHTGNK